jgi:hypothetical protein
MRWEYFAGRIRFTIHRDIALHEKKHQERPLR